MIDTAIRDAMVVELCKQRGILPNYTVVDPESSERIYIPYSILVRQEVQRFLELHDALLKVRVERANADWLKQVNVGKGGGTEK